MLMRIIKTVSFTVAGMLLFTLAGHVLKDRSYEKAYYADFEKLIRINPDEEKFLRMRLETQLAVLNKVQNPELADVKISYMVGREKISYVCGEVTVRNLGSHKGYHKFYYGKTGRWPEMFPHIFIDDHPTYIRNVQSFIERFLLSERVRIGPVSVIKLQC